MRGDLASRKRGGAQWALFGAVGVGVILLASGCGNNTVPRASGPAAGHRTTTTSTSTTTTSTTTTTTTIPCPTASGGTVPVSAVCSSNGAPHFDTPDAAMTYLAAAWNSGDVQEVDYVTDPNGRAELDSMAGDMPTLQFDHCSANAGAGDYTCYFTHPVVPSTSSTTYPNPNNYPPGEAVFTVGPASSPGWYLTQVIHCGG